MLAAHNIPIVAWPLLLGVLGAHRHRLARQSPTASAGVLIANTLPVGAALGAYGAALLPYLPQLPLEWAGLALGASAWLVQRRRALTRPGRARGARADRVRVAVRGGAGDRRGATPMSATVFILGWCRLVGLCERTTGRRRLHEALQVQSCPAELSCIATFSAVKADLKGAGWM